MLKPFKKNRFSSISLCDLNYIQIQCKLSGYIALFNFQTTFSFIADRLSTSPLSLPNCGVIFNLAQVWDLSNFVFNFFQTFFISTSPFRFAANCGMKFNISQFWNLSNLISNFFLIFFNHRRSQAFQLLAAWFLIYHQKSFCQISFQTFSHFFINRLPDELGLFRRQGFKLPHNFKIANLNSKIFAFFSLFSHF